MIYLPIFYCHIGTQSPSHLPWWLQSFQARYQMPSSRDSSPPRLWENDFPFFIDSLDLEYSVFAGPAHKDRNLTNRRIKASIIVDFSGAKEVRSQWNDLLKVLNGEKEREKAISPDCYNHWKYLNKMKVTQRLSNRNWENSSPGDTV